MQRVLAQSEDRLTRLRQDLADRDVQVEKLRGQNAEIAREMVDATNEAGQCKNELRLIKEKLKKA